MKTQGKKFQQYLKKPFQKPSSVERVLASSPYSPTRLKHRKGRSKSPLELKNVNRKSLEVGPSLNLGLKSESLDTFPPLLSTSRSLGGLVNNPSKVRSQ